MASLLLVSGIRKINNYHQREGGNMKGFKKIVLRAFPLLLVSVLAYTGCAPISSELRSEADKSLTVDQVSEKPDAYKGKIVIWGGEIIKTTNRKNGSTTISVLEKPLSWNEEPRVSDESAGRFLIEVQRFLDPRIFRRGRKITVAGEVIGSVTKQLGEMDYTYPLLLSKQIYIWPRATYYYDYPYPYGGYYGYYDPGFWGPGWWGSGGFEGGEGEEFEHQGGFREHGEDGRRGK